VHDVAREVAIAMRVTYDCDGTSVRQHNEPAGDVDDGLYGSVPDSGYRRPAKRLPYAEKLRVYFAERERSVDQLELAFEKLSYPRSTLSV
jgi:histidine triad (HIT) family protein